jgi:hypothetical protein
MGATSGVKLSMTDQVTRITRGAGWRRIAAASVAAAA